MKILEFLYSNISKQIYAGAIQVQDVIFCLKIAFLALELNLNPHGRHIIRNGIIVTVKLTVGALNISIQTRYNIVVGMNFELMVNKITSYQGLACTSVF